MNKFVCYLTIPEKWDIKNIRPISKEKIELADISSQDFKNKYRNAIFAISNTKEEAYQSAIEIQKKVLEAISSLKI